MADSGWDNPSGGYADERSNGANGASWGAPARGRTPSPSGNRRSRSPERRPMETEDRGRGGDRGRSDGGANPGNNLHVSGLSGSVEERDLEDAFSKYGRVQKAQVMRDPHSKEPRGFAFVTMDTAEEADAAIAGLNATEMGGKIISIERARRGRARTPTPGAYHGPPKRDVGNRPYEPRYDDRREPSRYDDRRRDDRGGGYGSYAVPMRDDRRYDDRDRGRYDDRRYDDRRSSRYDDYDRRDRRY